MNSRQSTVVTPYYNKENKKELIPTCITAPAGLQCIYICCSQNGLNMKRIAPSPCSDNINVEFTAGEFAS
jgi:hypothetical protein